MRYAELLVRLGHGPNGPISLAMARAETVARRVEQLLAETRLPAKADWKARAAIIACILPLVAISTGVLAQAPSSPKTDNSTSFDPDLIAKRKQEQEQLRTEVPIDGKILDNYVGYYQLGPENVLTITREGDQLFAQLSRQHASQVFPESPKKFFSKAVHAQFSFLTDAHGHAISLILHQNGEEHSAKRIDKAEAGRVAGQFAKRIKDGTPQAGRRKDSGNAGSGRTVGDKD